jgi:transketolase
VLVFRQEEKRGKQMAFTFGPRRGSYLDISEELGTTKSVDAEVRYFEEFDLIYRSLCAVLFNYVPTSGHPGGSISAGRMMAALLFNSMDYDLTSPERKDADIITFAAGHKALGIYGMWALRNEIARIAAPQLLPEDERLQLRLEDLLGFRRNPTNRTPLFKKFGTKALDGHPTPATPFVKLSTGASGVGVASSFGLAFGAKDYYGDAAPFVHVIEGEGGMTPGRVSESLAASGTSSVGNTILHVDWNQASIESEWVCRDGDKPGEYVQWDPMEFAYLHDWNVIHVDDGTDIQKVLAAQARAMDMGNQQPTAVVYRTTKGWRYGIEGKASHGAGHKLCCSGFFEALKPFTDKTGVIMPSCHGSDQPSGGQDSRCRTGADSDVVEGCLWEALSAIRRVLEESRPMTEFLAGRLLSAKERLEERNRQPRAEAPSVDKIYAAAVANSNDVPAELALEAGQKTTLRGELGRVLHFFNKESGGAILAGSADLYGSTSIGTVGKGFGEGLFNCADNPKSRLLSTGGICEDAMTGILSGIATFGFHVGAGSSYGAFSAPLGHIAARLHAIGNQAKGALTDDPFSTIFIVCAHAGVKTGEDGPTHADPQALQLLEGNFPNGTMITLTPWDPQEIWYLVAAALRCRPAVIAPFVTRPSETVIDRAGQGLAPAKAAEKGVYKLAAAANGSDGTVVLQGSEVGNAFVQGALPKLKAEGIDVDAYYVASSELFDSLDEDERQAIFPEEKAQNAMGISGFTMPTMYRWIRSDRGREMTLHPFKEGRFLGSGQADKVISEAGLDGESQFQAIKRFVQG